MLAMDGRGGQSGAPTAPCRCWLRISRRPAASERLPFAVVARAPAAARCCRSHTTCNALLVPRVPEVGCMWTAAAAEGRFSAAEVSLRPLVSAERQKIRLRRHGAGAAAAPRDVRACLRRPTSARGAAACGAWHATCWARRGDVLGAGCRTAGGWRMRTVCCSGDHDLTSAGSENLPSGPGRLVVGERSTHRRQYHDDARTTRSSDASRASSSPNKAQLAMRT